MNDEVPVYKFLRTDTYSQFYTTDIVERDWILDNLYHYELQGVAFYGAATEAVDELTGTIDVYRFFNTSTGAHFYTGDQAEAAFVQANLDNYIFEGSNFSAYNTQVEGTVPLYRFYNSQLDTHFYTTSTEERDFYSESPEYVAESGGIAYYPSFVTFRN
ncbi:MAG: hypothetical protein AAFQ80_17720 [Cyanobacteria bacterium J06621_8]